MLRDRKGNGKYPYIGWICETLDIEEASKVLMYKGEKRCRESHDLI